MFVHRLVAEHYCAWLPGDECVNHIDGDITNNDSGNLEWTTNSYNVQDGWDRGRVNNNKYADNRTAMIARMYSEGRTFKEIQLLLGGDLGTIRMYATGG